jgi:hypothetical protein
MLKAFVLAPENGMRKKADDASGAGDVQVFELTMDNTEDQDELNRRLRKPGEPDRRVVRSESTAESPGKKKGDLKRKS